MHYGRAVEKLRILAEECDALRNWPPEDPFLLEAYAFGDVLDGADTLECVEVVLVLNLPPQEVVWGTSPRGTDWLADRLRLSKGGYCYWWRSHLDPVWNHHVRGPVRFWSHDGPDEDVLQALGAISLPVSWMWRSVTCARFTPPTGTATGAGNTAAWAGTPKMSCGKP
jgi:hypothetical protein